MKAKIRAYYWLLFSAFYHAQQRTEPIEFRGWLQIPALAKWKGRAVFFLLPYLFFEAYFMRLHCDPSWYIRGFVLQEPVFNINLIVRIDYFTISEYYYEIWGHLDQGKD